MAYFDNAATTYPKPEEVYDFMDAYYRQSGASAGRGDHSLSRSAGQLIRDTREQIKDLLHCPAKDVVITPTATIALNMILQGLIDGKIHTVYITPFEHNAVTRILHQYEQQGKVHVEQLTVTKDLRYDIERIRYAFDDKKPDLVIMSHASNVIGLIAPVTEVFTLAKKYGAYTVADMSQTAGLIDIDVGLDVFDFAVFAGHKTLYGPTGASGFVMKKGIPLRPLLYGGTGYDSANQDMPADIPQRFEPGTLNISGIAGLHAALMWIKSTSITAIRQREEKRRAQLIGVLAQYPWIKIVGNVSNREYVGVVSCIIDGVKSDIAGKLFDERGIAVRTGLQCAPLAHRFLNTYPSGTIRLSVSYFTTDGDIAELVKALDEIDEII